MKNYKTVLIALTLSVNAQADFFGDVGDWVENNKTVTAIVGVGALTAAAVAVKPISGLLRAGEGEAGLAKVLAGAEGAGAEAEGIEAAASKLEVSEGAEGGEIFKSFKGHKYIGNDKWVEADLVKGGEGATGTTVYDEATKFQITSDKFLGNKTITLDKHSAGYEEWVKDVAESRL